MFFRKLHKKYWHEEQMHIKYVYKNKGEKCMQFTDEERKMIDKLLEEGEEMQRQWGNRIIFSL